MGVGNTTKMRKLIILIIIILIAARYSFSLKVYRSLLPIESTEGVAGLHYLKQNNANASFANSMTYCLRFNYKKMLKGGNLIWYIGAPGQAGDLTPNALMYIAADYPNSWWKFNGKWRPLINNFFNANQWKHLCIAYDKVNNSLTITKVNKNTFFYHCSNLNFNEF